MSVLSRWWRSFRGATEEHPFATDVAFAAIIGFFALTGLVNAVEVGSQRAPDAFAVVLVLCQTTAFAFRRRTVWWSLLGVVAFTIVFWVADYASNFDAFTLLSVYAATVHGGDDRRRVWRRVGAAVLVLTAVVVLGVFAPQEDLPAIALFGIVTIHLTAAFVGEAVYDRRRRILDLQQRAERAEAERELLARQAVLDERSRIAREMHDIVAHGMSVMVIQAGAAERSLDHDPEATRTALGTIGTVGRDSLAEMRRLLG
ncbi:MAG: histidine kinase dimerization/phosphoacceptor domain-containing protein, partial [Ilumatobacter fluminis]